MKSQIYEFNTQKIKNMRKKLISTLSLILIGISVSTAQVPMAMASGPSTACTTSSVCYNNATSGGGSSAYWSFGSTSIGTTPTFTNMTIPYNPAYNEAAFDGINYYLFVTEYSSGTVYKYSFGNSPLNTATVSSLGSFSVTNVEGIEIQKEGTKWYGFIVGNVPTGTMMRLDFGTSLANAPTATNLGPLLLSWPHDLKIYKVQTNYYGFVVNRNSNSVTRLDFGVTLSGIPTATNFTPTAGTYSVPSNIFITNDGTNFYGFLTNVLANNITRLNFGTSITNTPTYTQIAVSPTFGTHFRGITILKDCSANAVGYVLTEYTNQFIKLDFTSGLGAMPVISSLASSLAPNTTQYGIDFSNQIRFQDKLYSFVTNNSLLAISRVAFSSTTSTPASSTNYSSYCPSFASAGSYTLSLIIDEGEATQSNYCTFVSASVCSGINELEVKQTSFIHPNPSSNVFNITSKAEIPNTISVTDMLGREIANVKPTENTTSFDLGKESNGIYFVKVLYLQGQEIIKIIKE